MSSAMNDLFADLDDDALSPLDDASTSHTHTNGASRYSLADSASASTSTAVHASMQSMMNHHAQLHHHHHHQQQQHQQQQQQPSAQPQPLQPPPAWLNQDLPSWLSKQQAAPVSFAASAAEA
jgi:hypothetical protein